MHFVKFEKFVQWARFLQCEQLSTARRAVARQWAVCNDYKVCTVCVQCVQCVHCLPCLQCLMYSVYSLYSVKSCVLPYQKWLPGGLCANTQHVDDVHMAADHLHDLHLLHKTDCL